MDEEDGRSGHLRWGRHSLTARRSSRCSMSHRRGEGHPAGQIGPTNAPCGVSTKILCPEREAHDSSPRQWRHSRLWRRCGERISGVAEEGAIFGSLFQPIKKHFPQGLKPRVISSHRSARLKSSPFKTPRTLRRVFHGAADPRSLRNTRWRTAA